MPPSNIFLSLKILKCVADGGPKVERNEGAVQFFLDNIGFLTARCVARVRQAVPYSDAPEQIEGEPPSVAIAHNASVHQVTILDQAGAHQQRVR